MQKEAHRENAAHIGLKDPCITENSVQGKGSRRKCLYIFEGFEGLMIVRFE